MASSASGFTSQRDNLNQVQSSTDPVRKSITEKLGSLSPLSPKCCISRVPDKLHRLNSDAYTPRVVSIGPLHHGKPQVKAMEEHKLRYLQSLIPKITLILGDYISLIRSFEERARDCYGETIKLSSNEFVEILVLDGSFLLELLLRSYEPQTRSEHDPMFNFPRLIDGVCRDMLLIENQIPFFILEEIFSLLSTQYHSTFPSILAIVDQHFRCFLSINKFLEPISNSNPAHLVDFIRSYYVPSGSQKPNCRKGRLDFVPGAVDLRNAGIKFKPKIDTHPLDLNFRNEILEIPCLEIDDLTETLFRNLIVFEQCYCSDKYVIHYVLLLSCLLKSPQDADLLAKQGLIKNMIGDGEDVSNLFKGVCKEMVFGDRFYFLTLCKNLNAHFQTAQTPWRKWKAILKRDYFSNPWSIASVLAAVLLLVLTLIQTVCSVLALFVSKYKT